MSWPATGVLTAAVPDRYVAFCVDFASIRTLTCCVLCRCHDCAPSRVVQPYAQRHHELIKFAIVGAPRSSSTRQFSTR
ncbi:hypothetical protein BZL30_7455 [Mycobacterium kansasii]|uniref:Uncharacterized protein n=1 Tax=Mycobacterium kansasii TaxID=1768 RepID=A0A1V3WNE5_MYCKA|nr:hypothetical protein BZL30_7455 [Mycobacterium kansasii]